jgi:hypothetical protein
VTLSIHPTFHLLYPKQSQFTENFYYQVQIIEVLGMQICLLWSFGSLPDRIPVSLGRAAERNRKMS